MPVGEQLVLARRRRVGQRQPHRVPLREAAERVVAAPGQLAVRRLRAVGEGTQHVRPGLGGAVRQTAVQPGSDLVQLGADGGQRGARMSTGTPRPNTANTQQPCWILPTFTLCYVIRSTYYLF